MTAQVARYLYWAVDGGLHPGEMDLSMLIKCERMQTTSMRSRDVLQRLFDFFVHMSSDTMPYELDSATLADKVVAHLLGYRRRSGCSVHLKYLNSVVVNAFAQVNDAEFMQSFTMNKRPLLVLLERGFLQRSLEDEVPPRYIPFLAQMLLRPFEETGTELLVALCNQIAVMSQIEMNREKLIKEQVLLPLIELLRSDDDVLLLSVAKALVNLSSGNSIAKDSIVNEGGVRAMIPHLLNKPQELARAFCVLLKNCLTDPNLRERIINDGAIAPLVKLLHKTEIKDAQRSDGVVAAAAAAVWNLTAHQNAKPIVLRERAVEALVAQLRESRSPDVWQKCAGCLMVLAANSDKVKTLAGQENAVSELVRVVRVSEGDKSVLKAALGALAVLSSDDRNLKKMIAEGLSSLLERSSKDRDERIIMFVNQLGERLHND